MVNEKSFGYLACIIIIIITEKMCVWLTKKKGGHPPFFLPPVKRLGMLKNIMDLNLPPTSYDYFIHMACPSATETFNGMDSLTKFKTIVQGTKNVLEYASKCKIQIVSEMDRTRR